MSISKSAKAEGSRRWGVFGLVLGALALGAMSLSAIYTSHLGLVLAAVLVVGGLVAVFRAQPHPLYTSGLAVNLLAVTAFLLIVTFFSYPPHSRDLARAAVCGSNLNSLAKALAIYEEEHGRFPTSMPTLVADTGLDEERLLCPEMKHALDEGESSPLSASYFVLLSASADVDVRTLVACDRAPCHRGGRNILQYDLTVTRVDEKDFQTMLRRPENASFAAALAKEPVTDK